MLNFIFDLDDTLLATWDLFNNAENSFYGEMAKFGFDRESVEQRFIQIDNANVGIWGFMPKRFYTSMGETYLSFCGETGQLPDDEAKERLENIGRSVFQTVPKLLDGAIDVLNELKSKGDSLFLWTKGDENVQKRKIEEHDLHKYFDEIYILASKKKEDLHQIIQINKLPTNITWVVGDSVRSEINPALELGLNAILVSTTTWRYEEAEPIRDDFVKVYSLKEIMPKYSTLEKRSLAK